MLGMNSPHYSPRSKNVLQPLQFAELEVGEGDKMYEHMMRSPLMPTLPLFKYSGSGSKTKTTVAAEGSEP